VLRFVLHNPYFTNSLDSCLTRLRWYFERLKADSLPESHEQVNFQIGRLSSHVKYNTLEVTKPETLNDFLLQTRKELFDIAAALSKNYFGRS
jgi:uncharacterized alpha-E superfamily protein